MAIISEILANDQKTLLDVRTKEEFNSFNLPGSINIPLNEINSRIEEIGKMQKPIVVYCLSGGRSTVAASILKQAGIFEVYNGGGIRDMQFSMM